MVIGMEPLKLNDGEYLGFAGIGSVNNDGNICEITFHSINLCYNQHIETQKEI